MARYSNDKSLFGLEEKVYGYVERYIQSLSVENAATFMKYVSGAEMMQTLIFVTFNGNTSREMMIPTAHTCSVELEVSRFYFSFEQFKDSMDNILRNNFAWDRFDAIWVFKTFLILKSNKMFWGGFPRGKIIWDELRQIDLSYFDWLKKRRNDLYVFASKYLASVNYSPHGNLSLYSMQHKDVVL